MEQAANGIDIGANVCLAILPLLGGHVRRRSNNPVRGKERRATAWALLGGTDCQAGLADDGRQSKVAQLGDAILPHEDIVRLDVAMDESRMDVRDMLQRVRHIERELEGFLGGEWFLPCGQ